MSSLSLLDLSCDDVGQLVVSDLVLVLLTKRLLNIPVASDSIVVIIIVLVIVLVAIYFVRIFVAVILMLRR
jgi:hypothetical protein